MRHSLRQSILLRKALWFNRGQHACRLPHEAVLVHQVFPKMLSLSPAWLSTREPVLNVQFIVLHKVLLFKW